MSTPRQTVRDYLLQILGTIQKKNQYATEIQTVELKSRLSRDLNDSEFPAVIVTTGTDGPEQETLGNNQGNEHFRSWAIELLLLLKDPGDSTLEDAGEVFLADVMKCLIKNRFNSGKPYDIQFGITTNNFQAMENKLAAMNLQVTAKYDFTLGDLR